MFTVNGSTDFNPTWIKGQAEWVPPTGMLLVLMKWFDLMRPPSPSAFHYTLCTPASDKVVLSVIRLFAPYLWTSVMLLRVSSRSKDIGSCTISCVVFDGTGLELALVPWRRKISMTST